MAMPGCVARSLKSGKLAGCLAALILLAASFAVAAEADALRSQSIEAQGQSVVWKFAIDETPQQMRTAKGDQLKLDGFVMGGLPGEPSLPLRRVRILLPEDAVKKSVKVVVENAVWENLPGTFDVAPGPPAATEINGKPVLFWGSKRKDQTPEPNGRFTDAYETDAYTDGPVVRFSMQKYRQWNLATIHIAPVSLNPVRKTARILREATLRVKYTQDESLKTRNRPARADYFFKKIEDRVLNPESRAQFYDYAKRTGRADEEATSYLILVAPGIYNGTEQAANKAAIDSLWRYKAMVGHASSILVTDYGWSGDGLRIANYFRNYLQTYYLDWGVEYLLLIGDPNPEAAPEDFTGIPMMMCNASNGNEIDYWTPTDMCYAELSEDWNSDGDSVYGEWTFDVSDQMCELSVGRIPYYGVPADLQRIVRKLIDFQSGCGADQVYRNRAIIAASISNHGPQDNNNDGDSIDSGDYFSAASRVFGDTWVEAMSGLASESEYTVHTMLEKEGCYDDGQAYPLADCNYPLSKSNLRDLWQWGAGFVAWWGHGSETGVYRRIWASDANGDHICQHPSETDERFDDDTYLQLWTSGDCANLFDSMPSIVVQVSCLNGYPEQNTNLSYTLLRNGAAATLASSRVSWYLVAPWYPDCLEEWGDNASYAYGVYKGLNKGMTLGQALNDTRAEMGIGFMEASWMNMLGFNIYGDPEATLQHYPHLINPDQRRIIMSDGAFFAGVWDYETQSYRSWVASGLVGELLFDTFREKWLTLVLFDQPVTTDTLTRTQVEAEHIFIP